MERLIAVLLCLAGFLLALSWLLPNHYFPWIVFYSDFSAFMALLPVGVLVLCYGRFSVSLSAVLLLAMAAVPLAQWAAGKVFFFGDAFIASVYLVGAGVAIVLGRGVFAVVGAKAFEVIAVAILVGAVLSCWMALGQWLSLYEGIWVVDLRPGGRPYANLAQPNNLATLLCLGLAAVLYLWEGRRLGQVAAGMLAVFLVVGVVLTQSRTPWVGAFFFLFWWALNARKCRLRLPVSRLALWVATYAALVLAFPYIADALYLSGVSLGDRVQALHRLDLWRQLWSAVLQGGWWGYGWNQVSVAQAAVSLDYPVPPLMVEHSHNLILDILLWNGPLIGGLIIVLAGYWLVRVAWKVDTLESAFAMLVVGLVVMHGMLEFPLEYAFFLIPICLLLGMVEGDEGTVAFIRMPRWAGAVLFLAGSGLIGWVWHEYRLVEEDHRMMRFETARIGNLKAEQPAPDVELLTQLREFLRFARTQAKPNMTVEQMEMMRKVAHRYPYPPSLFRYSLALALNGQPERAEVELMRLRSLHGEKVYREARRGMASMSVRYPQLESLHLMKQLD